MKRVRYPGAQPFSEQQADIFFGRKDAEEELYQLINQESLVVLYGKSGMGKSSLLNAGVIPHIRKERKYRPIPIRFYAHTGQEQMPVVTTATSIGEDHTTFLDELLENDGSLWKQIKAEQIQQEDQDGILLIFDQFEELFTYPKEAQLQFRRQLAEALYTKLPQRYRDMLELYDADDLPFNAEQLALLQRPLNLHIIFSIRQDRMHLLGNLSDYLPTISKHWYELKALDRANARQAIVAPALEEGDFRTAPFNYTDDALNEMLDFLSGEDASIESTQLQIVCNAMEERVEKKNLATIDLDNLGRLDEIIENYYGEKINAINDPVQQLAARKLIEDGLIFEAEERRLSLYEGQIFQSFQLNKETLKVLVDSHLLRAEPSLRGGFTYELSHDTLVAPILTARGERVAKEEAKKAAEEKAKQQAELEEERAKRRRALAFAGGAFILAIIAIVAAIWGFTERDKAQKLQKDAEEKEQKIEQQYKALQAEVRKREELELKEMIETVESYLDAGYMEDARLLIDDIVKRDTNQVVKDLIPELQNRLK